MTSSYFSPPRPRLFAHRGDSAHFPENTLPAFISAVASGLTYLEMDVWATRDGHIVVHHDTSTFRLTGIDQAVTDLNLNELSCLDAGYTFTTDGGITFPFRGKGITIPTLSDLLAALPETFFNIEIKQETPSIEAMVLETVQRAGREETVLLAAEKDTVMNRLRRICGEIPTSFSYTDVATFLDWFQRGTKDDYEPPGKALQIPERWGEITLVSPESVRAAHSVGLEVHVWTVNETEDIKRLLSIGVDGVMCDYSDRLRHLA